MLQKFRVLNFCVKIFSWSRIPTKIFDGLNRFYVPRFGDLERDSAKPRKRGIRTVCCVLSCVCGYHAAVGELLAREKEPKVAVGTYCGSEDRRFIGH